MYREWMADGKQNQLSKLVLSGVVKEMAKPRLAASVRDSIAKVYVANDRQSSGSFTATNSSVRASSVPCPAKRP
jgi:hypothetical protein